MRDSWTDCPDRERSQWTFDVAMDVHQSMYGLDYQAQKLNQKWMLELTAWQKVDDTSPAYEPEYAPMSMYAPVPGHWVDELPNQSLQSIAYGFLTYWRHSGDVKTVRTLLPAVVRYLLSYKVTHLVRARNENPCTPLVFNCPENHCRLSRSSVATATESPFMMLTTAYSPM